MARAITVNFATTDRDRFIAASSRQTSSTPTIPSELNPKSTVSPLIAPDRGPCQEMRTRLAPAVPPGDERRVNAPHPCVHPAADCARHIGVGGAGNEGLDAAFDNRADRGAGDGLRHLAGLTGLSPGRTQGEV